MSVELPFFEVTTLPGYCGRRPLARGISTESPDREMTETPLPTSRAIHKLIRTISRLAEKIL